MSFLSSRPPVHDRKYLVKTIQPLLEKMASLAHEHLSFIPKRPEGIADLDSLAPSFSRGKFTVRFSRWNNEIHSISIRDENGPLFLLAPDKGWVKTSIPVEVIDLIIESMQDLYRDFQAGLQEHLTGTETRTEKALAQASEDKKVINMARQIVLLRQGLSTLGSSPVDEVERAALKAKLQSMASELLADPPVFPATDLAEPVL